MENIFVSRHTQLDFVCVSSDSLPRMTLCYQSGTSTDNPLAKEQDWDLSLGQHGYEPSLDGVGWNEEYMICQPDDEPTWFQQVLFYCCCTTCFLCCWYHKNKRCAHYFKWECQRTFIYPIHFSQACTILFWISFWLPVMMLACSVMFLACYYFGPQKGD